MYNDNEAKAKWCPMVRHSTTDTKGLGVPAYNRYGLSSKAISNPETSRCIASDCMMWREISVGEQKGKGYCGLAGKP
jgi:hypothetical protein